MLPKVEWIWPLGNIDFVEPVVSNFRDLHRRNSLRIVERRTLWWDTSSVSRGPRWVLLPLIGTPHVDVVPGQGIIAKPNIRIVGGICDCGVRVLSTKCTRRVTV